MEESKFKITDIVKYKNNYYMIVDKTSDSEVVGLGFSESESKVIVDYTDYIKVSEDQLEYVCGIFKDFSNGVISKYKEIKEREPKLFDKNEKVVMQGCLVKMNKNLSLYVYEINGSYAKAFKVDKCIGNKENIIIIDNEKYVPQFDKKMEYNFKTCNYKLVSISSLEEFNNINNLRIEHDIKSKSNNLKKSKKVKKVKHIKELNMAINIYSNAFESGTIVCLKNDVKQKYIIHSYYDHKARVISVNALFDKGLLFDFLLPSELFVVDKYSSIEELKMIKEKFDDYYASERKKVIEKYYK